MKSLPLYQLIAKSINDLSRFWRTFLLVIIILAGTIKLAGNEISEFLGLFTIAQKKSQYIDILRSYDSLKVEIQREKTNKAFKGRFEIRQEVLRIKKADSNLLAVSFVAIHNGGAELKVNSNWVLEVNESSDEEVLIDFGVKKANRLPMWQGLIYWGNVVKDSGIIYFEDIEKYPAFYTGNLKASLNLRGIKSVHSIYLGNDGINLFFASFDYKVANVNEAESAQKLRELGLFIKKRI